jgi:hypothetical protein
MNTPEQPRTKQRFLQLTPTERAQLKEWGGVSWMKDLRRRTARKRAMRTLDRLVDAQREAGSPFPEDPEVLAGLLAVSLRADGSIVNYFHSRGAVDLRTDAQWDRFFLLFAKAHLEQWLERRSAAGELSVAPDGLVVEQNYLDSLEALLTLAQQEGEQSQTEAQTEERAATFNLAQVSDLATETRERLRAYLETSDHFAHEATEEEIPEAEQTRDIEIAALSRLKLDDLQELAAAQGIPLATSKEALAELIVRRGDITREQIAELSLRTTDLSLDTGLVTRLFPLAEPPDIDIAGRRLDEANRRYLKLRLARWFVFDEARTTPDRVVVNGRIRSYRSKPVLEVEGHRLNVNPHSAEMVIRLRRGRPWAEVDGRQLTDAIDCATVMARGAGTRFGPTLALPLPALTGTLASWGRRTVWMLSFLQSHLERDAIRIHNYRMAHFEAADASTPIAPDQPRIAEIELRGQHVGASRDACQRIVEGAGLVAVELLLSFAHNADENYLIPVRITVSEVCATIETAAGKSVSAASASSLHRTLIEYVRRALDQTHDMTALGPLARKIVSRARAPEQAQRADMFAPQPPPDEPEDEAQSPAA